MKNKSILIILLMSGIATVLSGCITGPDTIDGPEKLTIKQEGVWPDWCKAGTKIIASGLQGEGTYEIKGITTYEGKSVCEAEMKVSGVPGGESIWKYYFTQNGEYAVMIMKGPDGKEQKIVLNNTVSTDSRQ